jgi:hypothetical protein
MLCLTDFAAWHIQLQGFGQITSQSKHHSTFGVLLVPLAVLHTVLVLGYEPSIAMLSSYRRATVIITPTSKL